MSAVSELETKLNDLFGKKAPQLPKGGKEWLVKWAPILTLIGGIFALLSTFWLWQAAHTVNRLVDFTNSLCAASQAYAPTTDCTTSVAHLSLWFWLALVVMAVEAILYIIAYGPLKAHKKAGWNYLYWVTLLNVAYAVVSLFLSYRGVGSFIGSLIGSALGFWLLFQIRDYYLGKKVAEGAPKA